MVEVSFAFQIGGAEIRGRIDAIFVDEDGTSTSSTGRPATRTRATKHRLQLPLYALAANRLWGVEPEKMRLAYAFVPGDDHREGGDRRGLSR